MGTERPSGANPKPAVLNGTQTNVKVKVPNTGLYLAGILQSTGKHAHRRLAIICHGSLGHKDYLFQQKVSNELAKTMDTYRFDFRGNGDSDGDLGYSNFEDDMVDLDAVVHHFEALGYSIHALIGHSRGAISCLNYAATSNHVPMIPYLVSISSRFVMSDVKRKHGPKLLNSLETQGYFEWGARSRGKDISLRVTKEDYENFIRFNTAAIRDIPAMTNLLLCHGAEDNVVPVKDVAIIQSHLSHARASVKITMGADHNYVGHYDDLAHIVSHYFTAEGRKEDWTRRILPDWKTWVNAVGGVLNFRTVGDTWIRGPNDTIGYMRPNVIYRCADISKPTAEGLKVLESLNIRDVFDLRSNSEIERRGALESTDKITRHHIPVFSEEDYSPAQIAVRFAMYLGGVQGFAQAYMSMIPNIRNFFKPILDHIVQKRTPFIVHCTAGKDRTGVVCALLQMICGVDEEVIAWEYELTRRCMVIKEEDVEFLKNAIGGESSDAQVRGVLSAHEEYMVEFLKQFHAKYGTIHEFLIKEMDMTMEQIEEVRNALVATIPIPRAVL